MSTNNIITLKLIIDGKEATATLDTTDQDLKKIIGTNQDVTDSMAKWGMIVTGFNQSLQLAQQAVQVFKEAIMDAATEQGMRDSFKGTAEDIELLRKATAGTVTEGNLLRLSNQATDLGLSMKDQALLFSLSEKAAIKMGVGTEEAFQRIVYASEGNTRGLRTIGIQVSEYNKIVNDMLKAQGETISSIDPEILKRIRLDAVIKLSGITLDDIGKKVLNDKEQLQRLGVTVEESKESFGRFINQGLVPVISLFTESGEASEIMVGGLVTITSFVVPLIPIMIQFKTAQALLATQSSVTAGALDAEAASAKVLSASLFIGIGIVAAVYGGIYLYTQYLNKNAEAIRKNREEQEKLNNVHGGLYDPVAARLNRKTPGKLDLAFSTVDLATGEGTKKDTKDENTVADIEAKIKQLQNERENMVAGSKELLDLDKQIAKLQESISPKKADANAKASATNNTGQEVAKTEDLKGKLEQIKILKDDSISQFEAEKSIAQIDFDAKIKGYDAEIAAIQRKGKLNEDDLVKIKNLNLQKLVAQGDYDLKIKDLTEKNNSDIKSFTDRLDQESLDEKNRYFEQVKYLDAGYLGYKTQMIDLESEKMKAAGLSEIQIATYKKDAIEQLDKEYYDWKWKKYQDDHKLLTGSLNVMWAGYDTFFQSITDKSLTGKERINAVWESIKGSFISMLADMLKNYLQGIITKALVSKTAQVADIAAATATGTAMAAAYAPAAAFASIMSYGAADAAGSAGLASTTALAYLLTIPKIPGFRNGSLGLVGEDGPEIIAPLDSYAHGQTQLILATMETVKREMRNGNQAGTYLSPNNSDVVNEIRILHSKIEDLAGRPSISYLNDREASKIYRKGNSNNRKSKL